MEYGYGSWTLLWGTSEARGKWTLGCGAHGEGAGKTTFVWVHEEGNQILREAMGWEKGNTI